jgi:gliding motility-associated-like protein
MKNITKLFLGLAFSLAISTNAFAQPANDQCSGAQAVTPNGACVAGTTVNATDNWTGVVGCQSGAAGGTHRDVWYSFVSTGTMYTGTVTAPAPWTGNVEFTLVSSATGCTGPFTIVGSACGASPLAISIPGLTNGATYYFTISGTNGATPGAFTVCSTTSTPAANCTDNGSCSTPQVVTYTTGVQTCIADCNTGAPAGPDFAGNNCFDFPNSTVWYQITTGASSASIDIALTSAVMTAPYFSVFTTANCLTYTTINCTQGAAGSASANVLVAANTTYLVAISNNGAATGNFNLCFTVHDDNSACNTTNSLTVSATSMGSPLTGPFKPGEIVTFCYNITDFQQINCNYLQGIVPSFGNCWDPVSFNAQGMPVNIPTPLTTAGVIQPCGPGPPCAWSACAGTPSGTWSWFPAGAVTYNNITGSLPANSAMPAGWYFLSSYNPATGACNGGDPTDPDNSYGDGSFPACGTNTLDWNVCFKLQALGAIACTNGTTDCSVTIHTYADGEIGVWNSVGCTADATGAASLSSNLCCTAAPTVATPVVYCQNAAASQLTATGTGLLWYTAATGGVGSATAPTPSTTTLGSTNYYVSSTSGGCESARTIITVTVNPNATITLTSAAATTNQTVCVNTAVTNVTYTIGGGGTGAGVVGLPAGVTGSFSGATFTISGTPTASGTFNYTVTTTGTCTQATATGTIIVNPNATITLTSAAGTNAQTICLTAAITNITYTIGGGGTGGTVSGLPAGVSGSFSGGTFTISGTPTVTGTFNYTVTTTGICTQTTATGTIIINPNATITLTSAAATTSQTLCVNSAITNITYSVGGGGSGATVSGLPAGVTGSFSGGTFTISGTPTASGTFNYTVTTTGTCTQTTATGTIIVNPKPVITSVPFTNETVCGANDGTITINATGTGLTYSINGGTTFGASNTFTGLVAGTYTIVVRNSAGCTINGGVISISSAGAPATPTATATPNPLCAGTTLTLSVASPVGGETYTWSGPGGYSATGSSVTRPLVTTAMTGVYTVVANVGACVSPGGSVTVTVNPNATISLSSSAGSDAQVICLTSAISNITYAIGGGGTGATVSGLPAGVTGSFSAGTFVISGTPTATGTFNYTVTTTGTCTQTSASGTITVNPNASILLTSAASTTSQTLCINTAITNITYSISGGGTGATVTGLPAGITGSFAAGTFTISGTPTATGIFNYTVNTTGTCTQTSANGSITVNPNATILLTSAASTTSQTLCINTPITNINYVISGGGTGATVTGLPAGVTGTFSGGTFTISGTPTVAGTFNYTVNTTGTCAQTSASGTITVNPLPVFSITSTDPTSCGGTDGTITLSGLIAGTSYNITYSNGATTVGPTGITADASGNIVITGLTQGTYSNFIAESSGCSTTDAGSYVLSDPAAPVFTVTFSNPTTCGGTDGTITLSGLTASTSYSVTYSDGATVVGPTVMSSDASGNIVITGLSQGSYNAITVSSSGCNTIDPGSYTLTDPGSPIFTVASSNPTTCVGTDGTITLSGLTAGTNYSITYSIGATVVGPTVMLSDASGNIIIIGLSQGSYNAIIVGLSGCNTTDPGPYVLSDPAAPTFTVASTNPTTCGGTDGTITLSGLTASTSYNVTYSNGATVVGPTAMTSDASGNIIITGLSQGSYNSIIVGLSGCTTTDAGPYVLTDPAAPSFTATPANPTICGGTDGTITLSGLAANTTYNVTYSNGSTVVGPASMTSDASGNIVISGLSQGTYSNVIVGTTGCTSTNAGPYVLTDPSAPTFTAAFTNPTVCAGSDGTITLSGLTANTAYNITYSNGATVVGPTSMTSDASGNIIISGLSQGSYSNIIVNLTGCTATDAGPYVLTDPAAPSFTATPANPTVCGGTDGTITLSGLTASTVYNVTYSNGATVVGPTSMTSDASGNIVISGLSQGTYSNIILGTTGCTATNAGPYTLTDPAAPTFAATSSNPTTCLGTDGSISLSGLTANTTYNVTYSNGATVIGPTSMTSDAFGNIVISGLSQGTYSNIIVGTTGCTSTNAGPYVLTDPTPPTFTAVAADPTICGIANGTITLSGLTANTTYMVGYLSGFTPVGPISMTSDASGNIVISGLSAGTYSNIVVSLAACGTLVTGPYTLISPAPPSAPTASNATYCQNTTINPMTANGTGGTYNWYDDAGLSVLLSTGATFTPSTTVTHTYYLTETVGTCQSPATPVTITINSAPNANAGPGQTLTCSVTSVNLDGTLSSTGVGISYSWTGPGTISGGSTATPTVSSVGTYTLTVSDAAGCSATSTVSVIDVPAPVASFTADPTTGVHPLLVNFTNTSQNSNTYVWDFGDGSPGSTAINPSTIYDTPGTYTVTLTASDFSLCPSTFTETIIVLEDYSIIIPNIFTPNGDTHNDVFRVITTGVKSMTGAIYDRWGLKVFEWDSVSNGWDGHTSSGVEAVDGTYYVILNVTDRDGKPHEYKGFVQLVR